LFKKLKVAVGSSAGRRLLRLQVKDVNGFDVVGKYEFPSRDDRQADQCIANPAKNNDEGREAPPTRPSSCCAVSGFAKRLTTYARVSREAA